MSTDAKEKKQKKTTVKPKTKRPQKKNITTTVALIPNAKQLLNKNGSLREFGLWGWINKVNILLSKIWAEHKSSKQSWQVLWAQNSEQLTSKETCSVSNTTSSKVTIQARFNR